jgi:hypothetical protein
MKTTNQWEAEVGSTRSKTTMRPMAVRTSPLSYAIGSIEIGRHGEDIAWCAGVNGRWDGLGDDMNGDDDTLYLLVFRLQKAF